MYLQYTFKSRHIQKVHISKNVIVLVFRMEQFLKFSFKVYFSFPSFLPLWFMFKTFAQKSQNLFFLLLERDPHPRLNANFENPDPKFSNFLFFLLTRCRVCFPFKVVPKTFSVSVCRVTKFKRWQQWQITK